MSIWEAGTKRLTWRETIALIVAAAEDTATPLGAEMAGLNYHAPMIDIVTAAGILGLAGVPERERKKILPFGTRATGHPPTPQAEYDEATAAMIKAFNL